MLRTSPNQRNQDAPKCRSENLNIEEILEFSNRLLMAISGLYQNTEMASATDPKRTYPVGFNDASQTRNPHLRALPYEHPNTPASGLP